MLMRLIETPLHICLVDKLNSNYEYTYNVSNKTRISFLNIPEKVSWSLQLLLTFRFHKKKPFDLLILEGDIKTL